MKHRIAPLAIGFALAVAGLAQPSFAQDSAPGAVAPAPDHDARVLLVHRYFEVIQFNKLMNGMMESAFGAMLADGRIPESKRDVVREAAMEAFAIVLPQMIEANVALYADAFTLEELQQLVAFYESPVGRSVMSKSVILTRESGAMITRFTPVMEQEMMRQMCARIDCPAGAGPAEPTAKRS